jgi:hypothetical protein
MARRKPSSWADRRWKIFEVALDKNPIFKQELLSILVEVKPNELVINKPIRYVADLLFKYQIPLSCLEASLLYISNQKLERNRYLKLITPPFRIWDKYSQMVQTGRSIETPYSMYIADRIRYAKEDGLLTFDTVNIDYDQLANALADGPMIEFRPGVNVTESKYFIDEYWYIIEKGLDDSNNDYDLDFTKSLLGKIYPTKTSRLLERNALIMELHSKGMNDKEIATILAESTKYSSLTPEYIKVIRLRQRRKK